MIRQSFIAEMASRLRILSEEIGLASQAEPHRLLQAKEYRAAVISAMTLLEGKLREHLSKRPWPETSRPMSMRALVERGVEQAIVPRELREPLYRWMRLRNEVVHSSVNVSRAQALEIVNGVMDWVGQL